MDKLDWKFRKIFSKIKGALWKIEVNSYLKKFVQVPDISISGDELL